MKLTVISKEIVQVDYKVLVAMSDGSLLQYNCERKLTNQELGSYSELLYKTREELRNLMSNINSDVMIERRCRLDQHKAMTLGWDYRARGY